MQIETMFLVTRLDGEVQTATPITDYYQDVSVTLKSAYLTDEDITHMFSHLCPEAIQQKIEQTRLNGFMSDEQEAKDFGGTKLSRYSIHLETYNVEIK